MSKSKFKLYNRLDGARGGTVTIDRATDLFSVRPRGRHREYVLPLSAVAEMVLYSITKAEVREKLAAKKRKAG